MVISVLIQCQIRVTIMHGRYITMLNYNLVNALYSGVNASLHCKLL